MQFDLDSNFSLRINCQPTRAPVGGPEEEKTGWCKLASSLYAIGHDSSSMSQKFSIREPKFHLMF